jgi:hypothetical protein
VRVPRLRVDGGDHPFRGHPPRDPPPPVGAIRALNRFDVLPGDQRQQRHRFGRLRVQFLLGQVPEQSVRITDQGVDQLAAGGPVVPGDRWFPRSGVVMGPAVLGDHDARPGHLAGHPTDRRDQLGDGVLGGHRIVEHRGIQRSTGLPGQHPGLRDHRPHRVEDPIRAIAAGQPASPVGQRGRVKPPVSDCQPACGLPPQIERHRLDRFAVRQPVQGLQHDHRGDHLGRDRRSATRLEQVGEQLFGEQLTAVRGQEREHPTHRQQVPGHRLNVQDLALWIRPSLHQPILPTQQDRLRSDTTRFSGVS